MRLSPVLALALGVALAGSGCGDDEPEVPQTVPQRPTPQRPPPDAAALDTMGEGQDTGAIAAPGRQTGQAGQPVGAGQAERTGQAGQAGEAGQPARADPPSRVPTAGGQRLYTVQVAAFTSPDSARKWTGRLSSLDLPVWTSVAEVGGTTYYRVRVGAVPTISEAQRLGGIVGQRFEWPVWVAPVTPADPMPEDVVERSRRIIQAR